MTTNTNTWPACQICAKSFRIITASHLKVHGHTFDTYRAQFPDAALVDESHKERLRKRNEARAGTKLSKATKDKMAASHTGKKHSQATKDAIGAAHKGKTRSQAEIDAWRISYYKAIEDNGGKGFAVGARSQAFKDKMSEIAKARSPAVYAAKIKAMHTAKLNWTPTAQQRKNYRDGVIRWMTNNPNRVFNTGVEIAFKEYLALHNVAYKQQFVIEGIAHPYDFYLPDFNTIVEVDGPQHWKQAIWGTSGKTQAQKDQMLWDQMEKDAIENLGAVENGFKIVRIQVEKDLGNFEEQMVMQGLIISQ